MPIYQTLQFSKTDSQRVVFGLLDLKLSSFEARGENLSFELGLLLVGAPSSTLYLLGLKKGGGRWWVVMGYCEKRRGCLGRLVIRGARVGYRGYR